MAVAALGFRHENLWLLFTALLLMGVHSSVFGPVKYSIRDAKVIPIASAREDAATMRERMDDASRVPWT